MPNIDIKSIRISRNLTLKEVAEYVGVAEATVSRWESGNIKNMRRDRILKLAKILNISPASLCNDDDIEKAPETVEISETKKKLHAIIDSMSEERAARFLVFLQD